MLLKCGHTILLLKCKQTDKGNFDYYITATLIENEFIQFLYSSHLGNNEREKAY